jgi:hypothetical protein
MITNKIETLDEVIEGFERIEKITNIILLGENGGIRNIQIE